MSVPLDSPSPCLSSLLVHVSRTMGETEEVSERHEHVAPEDAERWDRAGPGPRCDESKTVQPGSPDCEYGAAGGRWEAAFDRVPGAVFGDCA